MTRIQWLKNILHHARNAVECVIPSHAFSPTKRNIYRTAGLLVLVFLSLVVFPKVGFAEDATASTASASDEIVQQIGAFLTVMFAFLQFLLYPLTMLIAQLMDPDLLIGPDMEAKLLQVWVIFRNWVNIFFVLILVGIAIYNVLGIAGDGSNYALKAILPKIVIGLIAVNFSFLAGKVLIDASNVLTNAVYALPTDLNLWDEQKLDLQDRVCKTVISTTRGEDGHFPTAIRMVADGGVIQMIFCKCDGTDGSCSKDEGATQYTGDFSDMGSTFFNVFGAHNVSLVLMVNMGQVSDIDVVSLSEKDTAAQAATLTMQTLFGILMFLVFGFAYVAVVVVLGARLVVLWICLAMSPFIVIFFIFPDLGSFAGGEFDFKTQFFQHLFAPMVMGIVFSIGFVMLTVLQESTSGSWMGDFANVSFSQLENPDQVSELINSYGKDISDFGDLLIAACAVIIVWVGVFAAASKTIASSWTNTIKGAGESVGKFIAESPLYATVIPIPGRHNKDGTDMKVGVGNLLGAIPKMFESAQQKRKQGTQDVQDLFENRSPLQKYADNEMKEAKTAGRRQDAQGHFRNVAEKQGYDSLNWAKQLSENGRKLELEKHMPAEDYKKFSEALQKGDDKEVLKLLRENLNIRKAVLGVSTEEKVAWGNNPVTETESKEVETQDETEVKAQQNAARDETLKKGTTLLATAAGTATTIGALKGDPNTVNEAIDETKKLAEQAAKDGATDDDRQQLTTAMNQLFDNPNDPNLQKALTTQKTLKTNAAEFRGIKVTEGGKLDTASYVEAMLGPQANGSEGAAGAPGTQPPQGETATASTSASPASAPAQNPPAGTASATLLDPTMVMGSASPPASSTQKQP